MTIGLNPIGISQQGSDPRRTWVTLIPTLLFCALAACSPYVYSDSVQTLSGKLSSVESSYQDGQSKYVAEQHLANRIEWINTKPDLVLGPGCNLGSSGSDPCDLVTAGTVAPVPADALQPVDLQSTMPACDSTGNPASNPSIATRANCLKPLQRKVLLKVLDDYAAGLAALTKAKDRTDFDSAASKVSAAVGSLTNSAAALAGAGPGAAAAGTLAQTSATVALWVVGQRLDYDRLKELRAATHEARDPIHVLAAALAVVLEEQRELRMGELHRILVWKARAINVAKAHKTSDSDYGGAIDDAEAAADAFQAVRITDPQTAASALSDAHDALADAVASNNGQFGALMTSLETFAQAADDLAKAAATSAPANTPKK